MSVSDGMSHFSHRLEVRFRDCDAMGHTNNAVYLTFLEQARFAHWRSLWGFGNPQTPPDLPGVILAHVEADYRRPSRYGDVLEVRLTVAEDRPQQLFATSTRSSTNRAGRS